MESVTLVFDATTRGKSNSRHANLIRYRLEAIAEIKRLSEEDVSAKNQLPASPTLFGRALINQDDPPSMREMFNVPVLRELPPSKFVLMQKFEGTVIETDEDNNTFWAKLTDLSHDCDDEVVEISLEELDSADRPLVEPGAPFIWVIGFDDHATRERVSAIRFRRFTWDAEALEIVRRQAQKMGSSIGRE